MAVRERKSVWALGATSNVLSWYSKAVAAMQARPQTDPTSWWYQAFIHGLPQNIPSQPGTSGFWEECQHQSWFFVSWHRGYVAAFEAIVAKTVADLGGPANWALPYWNYSEKLSANPKARLMPSAFVNRKLSNGKNNPLWAPRRLANTADFGLVDEVVDLSALNEPRFSIPGGHINPGFGGPKTGWAHGGGDNGLLENQPHNFVHGQIGGNNGWMGNPDTAALDPIFWLHHCNIDRLWEVWRKKFPASADPVDTAWLSAVPFKMHDGSGQTFTFTSSQMLDTTKVLHGYTYSGMAQSGMVPLDDDAVPVIKESKVTELIGASNQGVALGTGRTGIAVALEQNAGTDLLSDDSGSPSRVWLRLENVTGKGVPGNFRIYADFPGDGKPPLMIGLLSTFGIERASTPSEKHGGGGFSTVIEISKIADQLGINDANIGTLQLVFERAASDDAPLEDLPDHFPEALSAGLRGKSESSVYVGRVGLYRE